MSPDTHSHMTTLSEANTLPPAQRIDPQTQQEHWDSSAATQTSRHRIAGHLPPTDPTARRSQGEAGCAGWDAERLGMKINAALPGAWEQPSGPFIFIASGVPAKVLEFSWHRAWMVRD